MEIIYYYSAHSAYAYLGAAELKRIADRNNAKIIHRPMDLRAVMPAAGSQAMTDRSQAHMDYFFDREIIRWAEHREIPVMKGIPTHHANQIHLGNKLLIAADQAGLDIDALSEEMLRAHWVDDADVASIEDLTTICKAVDIDAAPLLAQTDDKNLEALYQSYTDEAIRIGCFGSPTYVVGQDMFYGQDRLALVERALTKPYKGTWALIG